VVNPARIEKGAQTVNAAKFDSVGVDYLTCSYAGQVKSTELAFYLTRIEQNEVKDGFLRSAWAQSGYGGWRIGGLEWGVRHDGVLVRLAGETARQYWRRVGKLASNCSRIDLQTTVRYDEPVDVTIRRHFREVKAWNKKRLRPLAIKLWVGQDGAEAMYCGSRLSSRYLRLYSRYSKEKRLETRGQLRYEVELKSGLAQTHLAKLLDLEDEVPFTLAHCQKMFSVRGCGLRWKNESPALLQCPRRVGDVPNRLRWLHDGIRPTIHELVQRGYRDEVLKALGLTDATFEFENEKA